MENNVKKNIDTKRIPNGEYCYEFLSVDMDALPLPIMHVEPCPYLERKIDPEWNEERCFCSAFQCFDVLLDNQVKVCGINYDFSPEEEDA
jgi:hypothetical protein